MTASPELARLAVPPGDADAAVAAVVEDPELLTLVAQPIVDLAEGVVAGYEALTRVPAEWRVPPDLLFAAARASGRSGPLHRTVVGQALRLLDRLPPNTFLTVNVDPGDLASPEVLGQLCARPRLAPLVVEITEHAWPADRDGVDAAIAALRERGALIAADDVGAGYAGLNQLMHVRPDIVKIDRELVDGLGSDPAAEALVAALGRLCGDLDAWVIAEGVETEVHLAALTRLGVPLAQGWLFGRPAPAWPAIEGADLVRRRAAMAALDDSVASLMQPVGEEYRRDDNGRYWLLGEGRPCLTLAPSTGIADAVARALARPLEQRWTPLLVTSPTGHAIGVVPLEPLITAAARTGAAAYRA